jgi:cytochrome c6
MIYRFRLLIQLKKPERRKYEMKKLLAVSVAALALCAFITAGSMAAEEKAEKKMTQISGEKEFKEHCAVCHPDGGNIIKSTRTLMKKDLDAKGIKTSADIIKIMRNPESGMTKFDKKAISDKNAQAIAAYIMKTFK